LRASGNGGRIRGSGVVGRSRSCATGACECSFAEHSAVASDTFDDPRFFRRMEATVGANAQTRRPRNESDGKSMANDQGLRCDGTGALDLSALRSSGGRI
jgi:hypothetical protein